MKILELAAWTLTMSSLTNHNRSDVNGYVRVGHQTKASKVGK